MQSLTKCVQKLCGPSTSNIFQSSIPSLTHIVTRERSNFENYNKKFYPIQTEGEERRPAVSQNNTRFPIIKVYEIFSK